MWGLKIFSTRLNVNKREANILYVFQRYLNVGMPTGRMERTLRLCSNRSYSHYVCIALGFYRMNIANNSINQTFSNILQIVNTKFMSIYHVQDTTRIPSLMISSISTISYHVGSYVKHAWAQEAFQKMKLRCFTAFNSHSQTSGLSH